jgi:cytoskeletal protein RodZ
MAGRDTRSTDPDDWFADPDGAPSRRARPPGRAGEDDWIADPRPRRTNIAASLPDSWVPIAAGLVLVAILIIGGLALAGVFSGSGSTPNATTTQPTTTPASTPTTTPSVPSVPAPTTTLKPGDTGAQVKALQRALAQLGYSVGKVDGDYGTTTKTAVAQFQTAQKLTADGIFGPATRAALIKALNSG